MRVAHICSQLSPGGVTSLVADLLPALRERGVSAQLWHFGGDLSVGRSLDSTSCPSIDFGPRRHPVRRRVSDILSRIRASDVDIVHVHDLSADVLLASMLCDRRVVAHIHEAPPPELHDAPIFTRMGLLRRVVRPRALRRSHRVVACSEAARRFARRAYVLPPDLLCVVRNGIDIHRIERATSGTHSQTRTLTDPARAIRFGYLGRLDSVKNLPLLLRACVRMRELDQWSLTVIGDGPLRADLQKGVEDADLADRVRFIGEVTEPIPYLAEIDVLVHPSSSEGMSISVLEAMAIGIPVVAMRVGGNAECIVDGHTGLLVPPGDENAFVNACRMLAADDMVRTRMGRNGQRRVLSEFNIERAAAEIARCYLEVTT